MVDAQNDSLFGVPPPLVGRVLAELSSGMGKFGDAKKYLGGLYMDASFNPMGLMYNIIGYS